MCITSFLQRKCGESQCLDNSRTLEELILGNLLIKMEKMRISERTMIQARIWLKGQHWILQEEKVLVWNEVSQEVLFNSADLS